MLPSAVPDPTSEPAPPAALPAAASPSGRPVRLSVGDPAPMMRARSSWNPRYDLSSLGGRYVALGFFGRTGAPHAATMLQAARQRPDLFDGRHGFFVGVSFDPRDEAEEAATLDGLCIFWDFDLAVSRAYGRVPGDAAPGTPFMFAAGWLILDPMLRVLAQFPASRTGEAVAFLAGLPHADHHAGVEMPAPVLVLPRLFEPELCQTLIRYYQQRGGGPSGFMRDIGGKTVGIQDAGFKRRLDCVIEDEGLRAAVRNRIADRLVPQVAKAFSFSATRIERYIVACYDSADRGFFRPHRDNTTKGTAHRRFAVTINLNAEDYTGGDLRFPEFGSRTYRAPTGGAVVFACGLLHEATPVLSGRRYACLPFLYDAEDAALRQATCPRCCRTRHAQAAERPNNPMARSAPAAPPSPPPGCGSPRPAFA